MLTRPLRRSKRRFFHDGSRDYAEASLENLFASVLDVVRTGLADPILEERVAETVIALVAEMAAEMDGRDRKKLIDGVRWSGW